MSSINFETTVDHMQHCSYISHKIGFKACRAFKLEALTTVGKDDKTTLKHNNIMHKNYGCILMLIYKVMLYVYPKERTHIKLNLLENNGKEESRSVDDGHVKQPTYSYNSTKFLVRQIRNYPRNKNVYPSVQGRKKRFRAHGYHLHLPEESNRSSVLAR